MITCGCGVEIPNPSFSVAKGVYVTSHHWTSETVWVPVKSKSGRVYMKAKTVLKRCDYFEQRDEALTAADPGEPSPVGSDFPSPPPDEVIKL